MENETIKVLLVDDDQGDFEMFRIMLSKAEHQSFKIDWVSSFEEAVDALESGGHDVYFLDYNLEDRTGLDLLREARARNIDAPFIMLTGRGSRSVDMEAMELGASDYLVKGLIDPDSLERAIRHAMERKEGARALKERAERMGGPPGPMSVGPVGEGGIGRAAPSPAGSPGPSRHGDAARFWAVFDATRSGVALVDLGGMILKVNPPFAGTFAPSPRFTEGMSYLDLLDESDREAVAKEMEALAGGGRPRFEAARRFLLRDGRVLWAHTTSVLIRNEAGEPDHVMVVTERIGEEE